MDVACGLRSQSKAAPVEDAHQLYAVEEETLQTEAAPVEEAQQLDLQAQVDAMQFEAPHD